MHTILYYVCLYFVGANMHSTFAYICTSIFYMLHEYYTHTDTQTHKLIHNRGGTLPMEERTELSKRKIELENMLSLVRKRNVEVKTQ